MAKTNSSRVNKFSSLDVNIGVFGAGGRMGQEVLAVIQDFFGESCYVAVHHEKNRNQKKLAAKNTVSDLKNPLCKSVQVWIDFSSPQGFQEIYQFCQKHKMALVSGTTGLTEIQLKKMASPSIPLLWSPNMSLGINILLKALQSLKGSVGFDFQIEEFHHRYKKDKPSGTALLLQKELESIVEKKIEKPVSVRGGGIFGIHKVWAMAEAETISFEHQALNRQVFARGAAQAAIWLSQQKAGLYSLQNLLGQG